MTETVGDYLVARLRDWNVDELFAYPGDGINGINGIVAALRRGDDVSRFVQTRYEEMAAFAAVGTRSSAATRRGHRPAARALTASSRAGRVIVRHSSG